MGLILAAGKSKRFGKANKLLAPLQQKPLVSFAIEAMAQTELSYRVTLVDDLALDGLFDGFKILRPLSESAGLGENLSVGAAYAKKMQATHLLITLGDMPCISARILEKIKTACPDLGISIAQGSEHISVPACFHSSYFDKLIALDRDKGAGMIARGERNTKYVRLPDSKIIDVDTLDDLEKVARL